MRVRGLEREKYYKLGYLRERLWVTSLERETLGVSGLVRERERDSRLVV